MVMSIWVKRSSDCLPGGISGTITVCVRPPGNRLAGMFQLTPSQLSDTPACAVDVPVPPFAVEPA